MKSWRKKLGKMAKNVCQDERAINYNYIDITKKLIKIIECFGDIDCSVEELFLNLEEQGFF